MKFNKAIMTLLSIILIGAIVFIYANKADDNIINNTIALGKSGYHISSIENNKKYLGVTLISNTNEDGVKNMLSEYSLYVTYKIGGEETEINSTGHAFSHNLDKEYNEYIFNAIPKKAEAIKVTLNYKNNEGENANFTTQEIQLKK